MAKFEFKEEIIPFYQNPKNKIVQGDLIYCKSNTGVLSFWAIYSETIGAVCLDGGGNNYLPKNYLYLNATYNYWTIVKRIPCDKIKFIIEELE